MKIISKKNIKNHEQFYLDEILNGKIFIYPTDTIYGIGCVATNKNSIQKIKQIKQRDSSKPLSIIAPSKNWIQTNFKILEKHKSYFNKLPGPLTLIFEKKENSNLSKEISPTNSIGIRIPDHWISNLIEKTKKPFITTSINISGEPNITQITQLSQQITNKVDYIIDEGELNNKPSTIIDLTKEEPIILRK